MIVNVYKFFDFFYLFLIIFCDNQYRNKIYYIKFYNLKCIQKNYNRYIYIYIIIY